MKRQTGATMIEILVTILVLAVGLLGLSATQVMSLKNANNANQRYLAAMAAQEMAERMRANPLQLAQYNGLSVDGESDGAAPECATTCTPQQIVQLDKVEWGRLIKANLPGGQGGIGVNANRVATVTLTWQEQHTGDRSDDPDSSQFVLVVEL